MVVPIWLSIRSDWVGPVRHGRIGGSYWLVQLNLKHYFIKSSRMENLKALSAFRGTITVSRQTSCAGSRALRGDSGSYLRILRTSLSPALISSKSNLTSPWSAYCVMHACKGNGGCNTQYLKPK